MISRAGLFVVGIPVTVLATWAIFLGVAVLRAQEVTLAVTDCTIKNVVHSDSLSFRIAYGMEPPVDSFMNGTCACLSQPAGGVATATWIGDCSRRDPKACPLFIKGTRTYRHIESGRKQTYIPDLQAGIEHYFIPEEYRKDLTYLPPGVTIKVLVTAEGKGYLTGVFVYDTPILEWVRLARRTS